MQMQGWSGTPGQIAQLARFRVHEVDAERTPAFKVAATVVLAAAVVLMLTGVLG